MSRRDSLALMVLVVSAGVVGFGCVSTYAVLREYADVCSETGVMAQVWVGGAGLGPLVVAVAVVLAVVVVVIGGRGMRFAAAGLIVLAFVGATVGGAVGVAGKKSAHDDNAATYGTCGGYNS